MARLERQNRWLKVGMLALAAIVVGFICVAATEPTPKVVKAERLEVMDSDNAVRAVLGSTAQGRFGLELRDAAGTQRLVLETGQDYAYLAIPDTTGNTRAWLGMNKVLAGLDVRGPGNVERAKVAVYPEGGAAFDLRYGTGKPAAALGVGPYGGLPGLTLTDTRRRTRIALGLRGDESPIIEVDDKDGKVRWKAP